MANNLTRNTKFQEKEKETKSIWRRKCYNHITEREALNNIVQ